MHECALGIHEIELVVDAAEGLGDGRRVGNQDTSGGRFRLGGSHQPQDALFLAGGPLESGPSLKCSTR